MKLGEYGLHVYIQETRDLADTEDAEIDPIIKLEGFEIQRTSKVKYNVGNETNYWGDHYFFDRTFQERTVLED